MDIITKQPIDLQEEGEEGLIKLAKERSLQASRYWASTYELSREDTAFAYGEQWDNKALEVRKGRPTLTLNKMGQFIYRLVGDQRQNVRSGKVIASGNFDGIFKNTENTKDYKLSQVLAGLTKDIELKSNAAYHYKTAFQHAVEGGFGWLRVVNDYCDNTSFDQDLLIKSVRHKYTVMIDPNATEPDASDMNYAFVSERMSLAEFRERYPDGQVLDLERTGADYVAFWGTDETVVVSEYFIRKPVKRDLLMMSDGSTYWLDEVKDVLDELAAMGITVTRKRKANTHKVLWYKITAGGVLEGPKEWVGSTIPIVPVWGKEIDFDGKREFRGLIHDGKDAQRMHNYWMSAATERVALAPKSPWIGAVENFDGLEDKWRTANIQNWSYLPYNPTPTGDKPQRQDPPPMPSQELQIAALSEQGIKSSVGIYDSMLGQKSQETSGVAIQSRQQQGDTANYVFTDNLDLAIQRVYKILLECIPAVYDGNRIVRMHFEDGSGDFVEINKTIKDEQTGKDVIIHDLGTGKYNVTVTTGASYLTQRQEAASTLLDFAKIVPQAGQVGADLIAANLDAPNMDALAQRLKKTLPANMLSPEEQKELQKDAPHPQPNPQEVAAQQAIQMQQQMEQSKQKFELRMQELKLSIEETKLEQARLGVASEAHAQAAEGKDTHKDAAQDEAMIQSMVHDAVAQAMAELIAHQRGQQQVQQSPQEEVQEPVDNQTEEML